MRAERSGAGSARRGYPDPRAGGGAPRGRAADRVGRDRSAATPRVERPHIPEDRDRTADRAPGARRPPVPPAGRRDDHRSPRTPARQQAAASGPRTRGAIAVVGMFVLTLAAAAADSYIGVGLGTITLVALLLGSVLAALLVRRRDLLSVVVAPPLVFVAVALVNITMAPSATFSLPTLATLLIRGFPAMGLAFGAALVIAFGRLIARR
ncbi:MAG: conserved rane protein of unknown function [Modestobacter sp.]|nr:conserved rane protein of unknown function [Modestobacter sp.]